MSSSATPHVGVLSLILWLFLSLAIPMLGISMVSPIFDRMSEEGQLSVSSLWFLYWAIWVPLNALAWFLMLPGRALIRCVQAGTRAGRSLRLAATLVVSLYWVCAVLAWVWLVGNS